MLQAGDPKQCQPIGDDAQYVDGPYKGQGRRRGDDEGELISAEDLSNGGLAVREEFKDCVILQKVWRLDDGHDGMDPLERESYRRDADEFLRVTRAMADCTWTAQDWEWLSRRNKSRLSRTALAVRSCVSSTTPPS